MTFVYVFALPWLLFALAHTVYRLTRSLLQAVDNWLRQRKQRKTSYQKSRCYLKKQIWKKSSKKAGNQGYLKEGLS